MKGTFTGWVDSTSSYVSTTRTVLTDYDYRDDDYNAAGFCWRAASNVTRDWNYMWIDAVGTVNRSDDDSGTISITKYNNVPFASWVWFGTDGANSNKFVAFESRGDNRDYSFHVAAGSGLLHVVNWSYNWEHVSYDNSQSFVSGIKTRVGDWVWNGNGGKQTYGRYQYTVQYKVNINKTVGSLKLNSSNVNTACVTFVTGDMYRYSPNFSLSRCNIRFSKS